MRRESISLFTRVHVGGSLVKASVHVLGVTVVIAVFVTPASAVVLRWGETSDLANGVLGIPENLTGDPTTLLFENPGNAGFDVAITFSASNGTFSGGRGQYEALGTDQYLHFQSSASNHISWVEFSFYKTGTNDPADVLGFTTKMEDVERGNSTREWLVAPQIVSDGALIDLDFQDTSIFDFGGYGTWGPEYGTKTVGGIIYPVAVPGHNLENGTQADKAVGIDLSTTPLSYFRIGESRNSSSAGSVLMGPTIGDITLVPEPATLSLLGLGGLMLIRRRRAA